MCFPERIFTLKKLNARSNRRLKIKYYIPIDLTKSQNLQFVRNIKVKKNSMVEN